MWQLAHLTGRLDVNTRYTYLLLCSHFADTSLVATGRKERELVGFVMGYRPPPKDTSVFVWQIGVHPDYQGHGLGGRMLAALLARPACSGVEFLEATVTPSNLASERLFQKFAEQLGCGCLRTPHFPAELFGPTGHEAEHLMRIGPLPRLHCEGDPV